MEPKHRILYRSQVAVVEIITEIARDCTAN
jgi:hypothetical protein